LIRQADLPRTTSGKVQRQFCRQRYLEGDLKVLAQWTARAAASRHAAKRPGKNGAAHGEGASALDAGPASGRRLNGKSPNGHAGHRRVTQGNGHANGHAANGNRNGHATNGHGNGLVANGPVANGPVANSPVEDRHVNGHAAEHGSNGHAHHGSVNGAVHQRQQPMSPEEVDRLAERIETWLLDWLTRRAEVPASELDRDKPLADYGIDSLAAVELSQELEGWLGIELTPVLAWNHPTAAMLARYLAGETGRKAAGEEAAVEPDRGSAPQDGGDANFEALLAEIEGLSDDEAQAAIGPT
jgi:acyl carrier protein